MVDDEGMKGHQQQNGMPSGYGSYGKNHPAMKKSGIK
jgi:hypothetical protein